MSKTEYYSVSRAGSRHLLLTPLRRAWLRPQGIRGGNGATSSEKRLGEHSVSHPHAGHRHRRHRALHLAQRLPSLDAAAHDRHVPRGRHVDLRRLPPLLLAQELRVPRRSCRSSTRSSARMAAQNSILWWSSSHRVHHKYVDRDWDPYNIKRGFWWAHIFWIFYRNEERDDDVRELARPAGEPDRDVAAPLAQGDPDRRRLRHPDADRRDVRRPDRRPAVGRLPPHRRHPSHDVLRELARALPRQAASTTPRSRRATTGSVALLTLGEGYHSFHHRFPADFRNGIRWYQWDPAKWFIRALRATGLAKDLVATPQPQIEQARMSAALRLVENRIAAAPPNHRRRGAQEDRRRDHASRDRVRTLAAARRREGAGDVESWRETRRHARQHVRESRREWKSAVRMVMRIPAAA